jgi:hypothetical protein
MREASGSRGMNREREASGLVLKVIRRGAGVGTVDPGNSM